MVDAVAEVILPDQLAYIPRCRLSVAQIHKNLKNNASVCLIKYEEKIKMVLLFNEGRKILKMRMYSMWHVPQ